MTEWERGERLQWIIAIGAGLVLLASIILSAAQAPEGSVGWNIPPGAASEQSAVPINPAVLTKGRNLYQSKCQRCHGPDGAGGGADADRKYPPSDLTDSGRASRNPDGVLFYKIWNGRAKPKMPGMKSELTPADAWAIVHYVKTLRKNAPPAGGR